MDNPPCEFLEWDTKFFGFRIARVTSPRLTFDDWLAVRRWCETERIRCLYLLTSSEELIEMAPVVGDGGFRLVDIRVTLDRNSDLMAAGPTERIRFAEANDIPALVAIARESHFDSRFCVDPNFPRERSADLFQIWIEKSCSGNSKAVLVAEREAKPAGYITCEWSGEAGQIGLFAVAAWARGGGIGRSLVESSIRVFHENRLKRISVVTQGRNIAAQRLYQRCGFVTCSVQLWYHRWFCAASPGQASPSFATAATGPTAPK